MSFKTKQEAFAAMQAALATIQKINAPLPKPFQEFVDLCTRKVAAANTKTADAKPEPVAMDFSPEGDKIFAELKKKREAIKGHIGKKDAEAAKKALEELQKYFNENKSTLEKDAKTPEDKAKIVVEQKEIEKLETEVKALSGGTSTKDDAELKEQLKDYRKQLKEAQKALSEKPGDADLQGKFIDLVAEAKAYLKLQDKKIKALEGETKELIDEIVADINELITSKEKVTKKTTKKISWTYKVIGENSKEDRDEAMLEAILEVEKQNDGWQFVSITCTEGKSFTEADKAAMGDKRNVAPFLVTAANKTNINASSTTLNMIIQRNASKKSVLNARELLFNLLSIPKPKADPSNPNPATFVLTEQYDVDPTQIAPEIKKAIEEKTANGEFKTMVPKFTIKNNTIEVTGLGGVSSLDYQKTKFRDEFATKIEIE